MFKHGPWAKTYYCITYSKLEASSNAKLQNVRSAFNDLFIVDSRVASLPAMLFASKNKNKELLACLPIFHDSIILFKLVLSKHQ